MPTSAGRHFLQIPGPTNVPDRVLRAMDMPTMDHRGIVVLGGRAILVGGMGSGQRVLTTVAMIEVEALLGR